MAERAAEVQLPIGERIDDPDVLTAIRLAFVAPEPGDEPHSQLVKAIDAAGWDAGHVLEASARLLRIGEGSAHAGFWVALSQEVAAVGGVDGPPPARLSGRSWNRPPYRGHHGVRGDRPGAAPAAGLDA